MEFRVGGKYHTDRSGIFSHIFLAIVSVILLADVVKMDGGPMVGYGMPHAIWHALMVRGHPAQPMRHIDVEDLHTSDDTMVASEEQTLRAQLHAGIIRLPGGANEFRIPIMLPLHRPATDSPDKMCSDEPNPAAINDLKAALWAIDKINSDANFVAGIKFGAVIVDTCSSSEIAAERLAQYLTDEAHNIIGRIAMDKTDPEAERVISELSTALNMSAVGGSATAHNDNAGKLSSVAQTPKVIEHQSTASRDANIVSFDSHSTSTSTSNVGQRRMWSVVASMASAVGVLMVLACSLYFLMVFRVTIGTTILGYFILFGLLLLFSVNFLFLLQPSMAVCWFRRLLMSVAYSTILAGMLVKVMNTWRFMAYKQTASSGLKLTSPLGLLLISAGLVMVQIVVTTTWLMLFPPRPSRYDGVWRCTQPSASDYLIETESVVSLLYVVLLILITLFFCILTLGGSENCKTTCCIALVATWVFWSFISYKLNKRRFSDSRDLTIICANLACAAFIMIALYLRKLYLYNKLKRKDKNLTRLQRSTFPANFYSAFHASGFNNGARAWDTFSYGSQSAPSTAASSVRGSITSIKSGKREKSKSSRKPFEEEDQMDDGTASCGAGSVASSVQVQGHDLYPMEVYDGGSQFQPSSLFQTANSKTVYVPEDSSFIR